MTRTMGAALLGTVLATGFVCSMLIPNLVVEAQAGWQCKSWTLQKLDQDPNGAAPVGTWLGQAKNVEISAAGLSQSGLIGVVACKQ
jgi:hypothetical protein